MGRSWFVLFGVAVLVALPVRAARADNGPHGIQSVVTDSCAGCHRAHTARGANLLASDVPTLCTTCHDGTQATTNVVDGVLRGAPSTTGLKGGGFTNAVMDTSWTATGTSPAASRRVTSSHTVDGTTNTTLWGNGPIGSGPGTANFKLSCIGCHDPHGGAGVDSAGNPNHSPTYRLLRPIPTLSGATNPVRQDSWGTTWVLGMVTDETTKTYGVTSGLNRYFGQSYGGWPKIYELTFWCAQCHTRYDARESSGHINSTDPSFQYRHQTWYDSNINCSICHPDRNGSIKAADPYGVGQAIAMDPVCEYCHVAHGTAATMSGYAATVEWPGDAVDHSTGPTGNARSSLLRLDNRGICVGCHGKQAGFASTP